MYVAPPKEGLHGVYIHADEKEKFAYLDAHAPCYCKIGPEKKKSALGSIRDYYPLSVTRTYISFLLPSFLLFIFMNFLFSFFFTGWFISWCLLSLKNVLDIQKKKLLIKFFVVLEGCSIYLT